MADDVLFNKVSIVERCVARAREQYAVDEGRGTQLPTGELCQLLALNGVPTNHAVGACGWVPLPARDELDVLVVIEAQRHHQHLCAPHAAVAVQQLRLDAAVHLRRLARRECQRRLAVAEESG
jgi:hypothetical protein